MSDEQQQEPTESLRPGSDPRELAARHRRGRPEARPDRIGPYKILETLGEGGMGTVYLAEQTSPVHRRVALKIVKLGMDTKQVVARFEAEREALAMMNHPGVAKVFDAGVSDQGRPYFVMEYVPGISITDYCDRNRLSTNDRLQLFMQVCNAVQHAHQKGIIHRDIKPSNVLVAVQDGAPVPKVIDFGVAKATQQRLTEQTLFTEQGQLIGTPGYMSPEQAEMSALDVDTRTDIYSLGVLLYELLVGSRPFDDQALRRAGFAEIQRIIREVEPPKPSTRLSNLDDRSAQVAQKRRTELRTLGRILRGDLDWVVMKCLEKDRNRRYDTANALASEIQRYLGNEPVLAGPPGATYRLRKFVRRNKGPVAAGVAVAIVLVAGLVGTSYGLAQAVRAREGETEQRRMAEESEQGALAARQSAETARDDADKSRVVAETRLAELQASRYTLAVTLAQSFYTTGRRARALELLRGCAHERRGWEWRRLWWLLGGSFNTYAGAIGGGGTAGFSAESNSFAFPNKDGSIQILDRRTGTTLTTLRSEERAIAYVGFLGNGDTIVSEDADGTISEWGVAAHKELRTIASPGGPVQKLVIEPGGTRVAARYRDGKIRFMDIHSGEFLGTPLKCGGAWDVHFFPSGTTWIVAYGYDGLVLWDALSGDKLQTFASVQEPTLDVVFSADGSRVVSTQAISRVGQPVATGDVHRRSRSVRVWDPATGDRYLDLAIMRSKVPPLVSRGATMVVTTDGMGSVNFWNSADGRQIGGATNTSVISAMAMSPDDTLLATGHENGHVKVWKIPETAETERRMPRSAAFFRGSVSASPVVDLLLHNGAVQSISFSPDGTYIATRERSGETRVLSVAELDESIQSVEAATDSSTRNGRPDGATAESTDRIQITYDVCADHMRLVTGRAAVTRRNLMVRRTRRSQPRTDSEAVESTIETRDLRSSTPPVILSDRISIGSVPILSSDCEIVVTGDSSGAVVTWDAQSGRRLQQVATHNGAVSSCAISHDDSLIASGDVLGVIKITRRAEGDSSTIDAFDSPVAIIRFDAGGGHIACYAREEGRIHVIESATGRIVQSIDATIDPTVLGLGKFGGTADKLSFGPNGGTLAAIVNKQKSGREKIASSGYEIRVWEIATGRLVFKTDAIGMLAYSPDGRRLVHGMWTGSVFAGVLAVRDADTNEIITTFDFAPVTARIRFSADGERLVADGMFGYVVLHAAPKE